MSVQGNNNDGAADNNETTCKGQYKLIYHKRVAVRVGFILGDGFVLGLGSRFTGVHYPIKNNEPHMSWTKDHNQ